jgi:hypothetical protein
LNQFLHEHGFDDFAEAQCAAFYAETMGRPGLAPGIYFRLLLIGYFEGIDSERGHRVARGGFVGVARFSGRRPGDRHRPRSTEIGQKRAVGSSTDAEPPEHGFRTSQRPAAAMTGTPCSVTRAFPSLISEARTACRVGLCLLPTRADGSKAPAMRAWRAFKMRRPTTHEFRAMRFDHAAGFGVVAGHGVEAWDFDDAAIFDQFLNASATIGLAERVARIRAGYEDETPRGGRRWLVRYPNEIAWRDKTLAARDPFTKDEGEHLIETARKEYPEWHPWILCALRTGLRLGELLALQWGDLDWHGRYILVTRSLVRGVETTPKNHHKRRVDLSPQLRAVLRLWRLRQNVAWLKMGKPRPDWVFCTSVGTPFDDCNVRRSFRLLLDAAGLHRRGPHEMRHSFASLLLQAGEPITYVSAQLGHRDSAITLRVYAHWLPDTTGRKGVDRLDSISPRTETVAHALHTASRIPLRRTA